MTTFNRRKGLKDLLMSIIGFVDTTGRVVPDVGAKVAQLMGSVVFSLIDIALGGMTLGWIFSQKAPPEFATEAKYLAWALGIASFYVVRMLIEDKDGIWWQGRSLYGWLLNLGDSFLDASVTFILFGLGGFLLNPSIAAFKQTMSSMPVVGWVIFAVFFLISFFAEHFREAMKPGGSQPAPRTQPAGDPRAQPARDPRAQPTGDPRVSAQARPQPRVLTPEEVAQRNLPLPAAGYVYVEWPVGSNHIVQARDPGAPSTQTTFRPAPRPQSDPPASNTSPLYGGDHRYDA